MKWIRSNIWKLVFVGLFFGNMVCTAYLWRVVHRVQTLNVAMSDAIRSIDVAVAYVETPDGLHRVPADEGLTKDDLAFVARFRGHILRDPAVLAKMQRGEIIARLRADILASFAGDPANLQLGKTAREALIAFAVLRTRGSISTYQVRPAVPDNLDSLILGTSGNCYDFALRLMMVLEALDMRASFLSIHTPNLLGHVIVDAYDPQENASYLLDSTFSVMISMPHSNKMGFMENVLRMDAGERSRFAASAEIRAFPDYYRFVDPGEQGLKLTPVTAPYINRHMSDREPMWRKWLALDTRDLAIWWKSTPNHVPRTLDEYRGVAVSRIPQEFDKSGDYASRLRAAAVKFLGS